jgi:aminoglycoside/choline kinase family phosphotransferase
MIPDHGPRTVDVQDGVIQSFRSSGMTFSGLHLVRKDLLDFLPREETFCSVIPAYEAAMKQGHTVLGIPVAGSSWEDAGTPERLLAVNGSSICFPGSQVSKRVTLDQALVGPGTRLRAGRKVSGVVLSPARGLTPAEQQRCPDAEAVEELPARGSDRSFARIHFSERTFIRIRSGQQRPENRRTAGHLRFLVRKGIPVPKVHYASRDGSLLLLEDGGTEHLLDRLQQGSAPRNRNDMQQALKVTADLHAIRVPSRLELEPPFSPRLYHWEHQLFFREFLSRFDPDADLEALNRSLQKVARGLQKRPKVLLHRDLQSTNFLWTAKGPMLIDVQGMRKGPAAYDLASLLADPYVNRSPEEQRHLLRSYETYSGTLVPLEIYALGATQRLVQALGAYGRLGAQPETRRFLVHVPAALQQLQVWAPVGPLQRWAETFLQNWTEPQP